MNTALIDFASDKEDVCAKYPNLKVIKEVTGNFNMLFIKNNQSAIKCSNGKFYIITH